VTVSGILFERYSAVRTSCGAKLCSTPALATKLSDGIHFGTGLKLMYDVQRYHYTTLPLSVEQRAIFEAYGAPQTRRQAPGP